MLTADLPMLTELPRASHDRDGTFVSPFDQIGPSAVACEAAAMLQRELRSGFVADGFSTACLNGPDGGKMFGVLVVRTPQGRLGFLRAFSGVLAGRWEIPGYVPPLFDIGARAQIEPEGEAIVKNLLARAEAFQSSDELREARAAVASLQARHDEEAAALRAQHLDRRARRKAERAVLTGMSAEERGDLGILLDRQSQADKRERRELATAHSTRAAQLAGALKRLERRAAALERLRHSVCRRLMRAIQDTYVVRNALGQRVPIRDLFAPAEPPSGAGDCAAPKLLAYAYANGLRPVALAEFWWGAPPPTGGRLSGEFYPACRGKCGPLLPFMLQGIDVEAPRKSMPPALATTALDILYEDDFIVIVDKPCGLLSVPSSAGPSQESVLALLRARYRDAAGPLLVHRIDMDTSGLLVAALDARSHRIVQKQFIQRTVEKRYVAWVDGPVAPASGTIDLPIRVDLDDRPRHIYDPESGKSAVTDWRVQCVGALGTRVAFYPRTGRTHQIRVHAAHPRGLGAAIVGDRLYGRPAERMMLHAESISFRHPATGEHVSFESPAPF